jgi:2-amino-4-hydroxy-6-hydroxymethyldihydropteridine diphosphokinase
VNRAVVGIGSNIEPQRYIDMAIAMLAAEHRLLRESRYVRTKAIGRPQSPDYLNGAALVGTTLEREAFIESLHVIEERLGRKRTEDRYADRTIDLDLVAWNGQVLDPDLGTRDFLRNAALQVEPALGERRKAT